jgi:hypothetical protein
VHGVHGVGGSNPLAPTNRINESGQPRGWPFSFLKLSFCEYPCTALVAAGALSAGQRTKSRCEYDFPGLAKMEKAAR